LSVIGMLQQLLGEDLEHLHQRLPDQ